MIGPNGTTAYIGDYYEQAGSTIRKYYYAGGQRIAVRVDGILYFLHTDHLGSATLATDVSGNRVGEVRYKPYGEIRYEWGITPTDRRYTGQRWDSGLGLYDYRARYYHPALGRFVSADTLVQANVKNPAPYLPLAVSYADPKVLEQWNQLQRARLQPGAQTPSTPSAFDPQFLNRYSYGRNNPLAYVDDSGHIAWWVVGGVVGGVVGLGAYAITHRDNFDWKQAVLWTAGGAVVGATFGAGAQWVAGALGAKAAVTAGTAGITTIEMAASSPAGQQLIQSISRIEVAGPKLEYLLRLDPGKAKGFERLGCTLSNKEALQQALLSLGQRIELSSGIVTEYGTKFKQVVEIIGPNGVRGRLTIIWQVDKGSDVLRLITAIAEPFK